ncbi:MAG TPA: cation diffusion facilitator family transporter [Phycisphaerae bacterium]|nr:cation diffusion facilitator family transporter [Phycisphaerae bacterium]
MPDTSLAPVQQETRRRVRAVRIAIAASFSVGVIEAALGWILGLESLIAEGIHTLLDGVDSIVVLVAVLIAARPADRSHQFGHGKFEALGATVEGSFVLVAAGGIAWRAIGRLLRGEAPEQIPLYVCVAMGAAAVFYLVVSLYLMREARATKSPALLAEALHLQTHIYITGGLGVGLLIGAIGDWPITDTILALAVAICLVWISGHIFREVIRQFTDAALPANELDELGRIIERFSDRFLEVHGVRTRQSGAERHLEMHLVVAPETTVASAHALGHEIEAAIAEKWPTTRTMVHLEPLNTADRNHEQWMAGQPKVRTHDASPDEREFIH